MLDKLQERLGEWRKERQARRGGEPIVTLSPAFWDSFEDAALVSMMALWDRKLTEKEIDAVRAAWEKVWQEFDFRKIK